MHRQTSAPKPAKTLQELIDKVNAGAGFFDREEMELVLNAVKDGILSGQETHDNETGPSPSN